MKFILAALTLLVLISLSCTSIPLANARGRVQGWCQQGNQRVTITGAGLTGTSNEFMQESAPSCTVTVFDAGTVNSSTIFSDDAGTAQGNPFTAAASGIWFFYADNGRYDVQLSGGAIDSAFTLGDFNLVDATLATGLTRDCTAQRFGDGTDAGVNIQACVNDLPATGGIADARGFEGAQTLSAVNVSRPAVVLFSAATFTVTGQFRLTANGAAIIANSRQTVFEKGFNGDLVTLEADGNRVVSLRMDGKKATFTGKGIVVNPATNFRIEDNHLIDFENRSIDVQTSSRGWIVKNRIEGQTNSGAIFLENNATDITINDNDVESGDTGNTDAIEVHSTTGGQVVQDIVISNNRLYPNSTSSFGIEVGAFGGDAARRITITGNVIIAQVASFGGISVGDVAQDVTVSGNTYDAAGLAISIAAYELVNTTNVTVSGNVARCGNDCTPFTASRANSNISITGNTFDGARTAVSGAQYAMNISVSTADAVSNISITGNVILVPADAGGGGTHIGVRFLCNHASATFSDSVIKSNVIIGTSATTGVEIGEAFGTMTNITIADNNIDGFNEGIQAHTGVVPLNIIHNVVTDFVTEVATSTGADTHIFSLDGDHMNSGRYETTLATTLVAGDFALNANWGATATIGTITGNDQRFRAIVTSAGAGQGASPTVTLTFSDGAWTSEGHFYICGRAGGSQAAVQFDATSGGGTTLLLTFQGTPVAAETYTFTCVGMG